MPVVKVYGMPCGVVKHWLKELETSIQRAIADTPALRLEPKQVTVFFPVDLLEERSEEEIIIYIDLYAKPERTIAVLQEMNRAVGHLLKQAFPNALVECFANAMDPATCWSSAEEESV